MSQTYSLNFTPSEARFLAHILGGLLTYLGEMAKSLSFSYPLSVNSQKFLERIHNELVKISLSDD